jgi:hypothetical protein
VKRNDTRLKEGVCVEILVKRDFGTDEVTVLS